MPEYATPRAAPESSSPGPVARSITTVTLEQASKITSESGEPCFVFRPVKLEEPVEEISEEEMAQAIADFDKMLAARGTCQSNYNGGLRRYSPSKFTFTTHSPSFALNDTKGKVASQAMQYRLDSPTDQKTLNFKKNDDVHAKKNTAKFEESVHHNRVKSLKATKSNEGLGTSTGKNTEMVLRVKLDPRATEFIPQTAESLRIKNLLSGTVLNAQHQSTQLPPQLVARGIPVDSRAIQAAPSQVMQAAVAHVDLSSCVFIMQTCTSKFPVLEGVYSTSDAAITAAKQRIGRFGQPSIQNYTGSRYQLLAGHDPVASARVFPQELLGATKIDNVKKVFVTLDIGDKGAITVVSAHDTVRTYYQ